MLDRTMKILRIFKNKLFIPIATAFLVIIGTIYILIPYQMNKIIDKHIVQQGIEFSDFLTKTKEYYSKYIVATTIDSMGVEHNSKNNKIYFMGIHKGVDNILPTPASLINDLGTLVNSDIIVTEYSHYPFKQDLNRKLTKRQKEILKTIKSKEVIVDRFTKDGKEFVKISRSNYMTDNSCISCHNNHIDRNWNTDRWKLNDFRGVIDFTYPIDFAVYDGVLDVRNNILGVETFIFLLLFIYFSYMIIKREDELKSEQLDLNSNYDILFKDIKIRNELMKSNYDSVFNSFDENVIYSKTNLFGIIIEVSDAFCQITQFSKKELIGQSHSIIKSNETSVDYYNNLWGTLNSNKLWNGIMMNTKKDGEHYWVSSVISPIFDDDGVKIGYISISIDITETMKKKN